MIVAAKVGIKQISTPNPMLRNVRWHLIKRTTNRRWCWWSWWSGCRHCSRRCIWFRRKFARHRRWWILHRSFNIHCNTRSDCCIHLRWVWAAHIAIRIENIVGRKYRGCWQGLRVGAIVGLIWWRFGNGSIVLIYMQIILNAYRHRPLDWLWVNHPTTTPHFSGFGWRSWLRESYLDRIFFAITTDLEFPKQTCWTEKLHHQMNF